MQHQEEGARRAAVRGRHCRKLDLSRPLEGRWPPANNQEIRPVCARGDWWRRRAGMKGNLRASALSLRPVGTPATWECGIGCVCTFRHRWQDTPQSF